MNFSYGTTFSIAFMVAGWLMRAAKDHKITAEEWLELLELIGREMGFPVDVDSLPTKDQLEERRNSPSSDA